MPGDLLSEAQALSSALLAPDPIAESAVGLDLTMIQPTYEPVPPPPPPDPYAGTELDPDSALPMDFEARGVNLEAAYGHIAGELGADAPAALATALRALPRDVAMAADAGAGGLPIAALVELGRSMATTGPDDGVMAGELDVDTIAAHARGAGIEADLVEIAHVTTWLNALPATVRSAITEDMASDPGAWALAVELGRDLPGFELRRPLTRR